MSKMTQEQLRKIDYEVAYKVMGWNFSETAQCSFPPNLHSCANIIGHEVPKFSTDPCAAWEVLDLISLVCEKITLRRVSQMIGDDDVWFDVGPVPFYMVVLATTKGLARATEASLELAICKAVLAIEQQKWVDFKALRSSAVANK